jgi:hypothetical protein
MGKIVKVTVNLPEEDVETVKQLADERGVSATHVIREGIASEKFISEVVAGGGTFLVERDEGAIDEEGKPTKTVREVLFKHL